MSKMFDDLFFSFFLVIDPIFSVFACLRDIFTCIRSYIYHISPFLDDKNLRDTFLHSSCVHTHSDNTTSANIGGTDTWAVLHLKFWGTFLPVPLMSPPMF